MAITLGSNIAALTAQRQLDRVSLQVGSTYERLASGLRINKASDDAAGLAIASSLSADSRIYSQAIRNANDGISALNIAEGALQQLSGITTRIAELSEQSANGVFTYTQRQAMDGEAQQLRREYARIAATTQFNGRALLASSSTMSLQIDKNSYGANGENYGQISIDIGSNFGTAVGDGTFEEVTPISAGVIGVGTGDLNGDGITDIVGGQGGGVFTFLGNGDGTFQAAMASLGGGPGTGEVHHVIDLDNDGDNDVVSGGWGGAIRTYLNNGSGVLTFNGTLSAANGSFDVGDVNGDSFADIIISNEATLEVAVFLNDQDGTFTAGATYVESDNPYSLELVDLNGDGALDLISTLDPNAFSIRLGNGDGTFGGATDYAAPGQHPQFAVGDLNNDGRADIFYSLAYNLESYVLYGNGDGTMQAATLVPTVTARGDRLAITDLNGDGADDIVVVDETLDATLTYLNNGSGSFTLADQISSGSNSFGLALGDFDGDGVLDIVNSNPFLTEVAIYLANSSIQGVLPDFDLRSQSSALAALDQMRESLADIATDLSKIGATQSRLEATIRNLMSRKENVIAAGGRIQDVDVAIESSQLVRSQILQQAAASVLTQANQQPALSLRLLS